MRLVLSFLGIISLLCVGHCGAQLGEVAQFVLPLVTSAITGRAQKKINKVAGSTAAAAFEPINQALEKRLAQAAALGDGLLDHADKVAQANIERVFGTKQSKRRQIGWMHGF